MYSDSGRNGYHPKLWFWGRFRPIISKIKKNDLYKKDIGQIILGLWDYIVIVFKVWQYIFDRFANRYLHSLFDSCHFEPVDHFFDMKTYLNPVYFDIMLKVIKFSKKWWVKHPSNPLHCWVIEKNVNSCYLLQCH